MTDFVGTPLVGTAVTSGAISTLTAITAGDITVNSVPLPAIGAAADANTRVDQLVAAFNSVKDLTGIVAVKVSGTTYELTASVSIVIAALGATATLANCGLTAGTTAFAAGPILASRKQFGTNRTPSDDDVVSWGSEQFTVRDAKRMGFLDVLAGSDVEVARPSTPTRVG